MQGGRSKAAPPAGGRKPKSQKAQSKPTSRSTSAQASNVTSKVSPVRKDSGKKRKHAQDDKSAAPAPAPKKNKKSKNNQSTQSADADEETRALLEEIRALGGDEEDLALIGGVESDSEGDFRDQTSSNVDPALQADLKKLAAELGLDEFHSNGNVTVADEAPDDDDDDKLNEEEDLPMTEDEAGNHSEEESQSEGEGETLEPSQQAKPPSKLETSSEPVISPALKKQFIFEPRADWHAVSLSSLPRPSSANPSPYINVMESLKSYGLSLLEADAETYSKSILASSSHKFLSTIMSSGTLSDKVSALTLAVQESPVHNIKAFDALMNLAAKRSRGQAMGALGALVDLLGPGLILPADRRLRTFHSQEELLGVLQKVNVRRWTVGQPLPGSITKAHLVYWVYEDWLKSTYFKIIQLLELWCNDEIEYSRIKSLDFVFALMKEKPEQEANLLRLLVNKLGDRDKKISSRASYLLLQLQTTHPGMKAIITKSIEQEVLLRPGQGTRAKYYAISTLNQTILSKKEPQIAELLLQIYFDLFVILLNGPMSGSLSAEQDEAVKAEPAARSKSSKGPLAKPSTVSATNTTDNEAVEKLVSAVLTGVNRAAPFVASDDPVLENQIDTLFRIAHSANFNTSIQALILIQQLSATRHIAFDRFYRTLYESLLDPRLIVSSKQALYLNLVLRALKSDVDTRRVKAFVKRMLQTLGLHQASFACGILYVVIQLQRQFADLKTLLEEPEETEGLQEPATTAAAASHHHNTPGSVAGYDGRKRDPEHSNAQHSCLWEVLPFLQHFHPSVAVYAQGIIAYDEAVQKPDLESHNLIRFLDKFVYRNPKATDSSRGVSIMQPVRGPTAGSGLGEPLNQPGFWNKKVDQVAAEDVFFHRYFEETGKPNQAKPATGGRDTAVGSDDEDEDEVWNALNASHPDGPIDDSDDADLDMDGFDDESDEGDAGEGQGEAGSMFEGEDDVDDMDDDDDDDGSEGGIELFDDDGDLSGSEAGSAAADEGESEKKKDESRSERRKRLKNLPMFASMDDYAELMDGGDDEDM